MSEVVLLWEADSDIQRIFDREEDYQEGRGAIFFQKLDLSLERLRAFPQIGSFFKDPYRRLIIVRTPYGIFYSIQGKRIIVAAVLNLRDDPSTIKKRLVL